MIRCLFVSISNGDYVGNEAGVPGQAGLQFLTTADQVFNDSLLAKYENTTL